MSIELTLTPLQGVVVLTPKRFSDDRGHFEETWSRRNFHAVGLDIEFLQDNHSYSTRVGTLRGLHFQSPPHAQDKLVRCTRGAIFDVAVDIRLHSPTYGQWFGVELTPMNGKQILVPKGFLHGFVTREPDTEVEYKCSDYYDAACDGSVLWDSLDIAWPIAQSPILSAKDASAIPFSKFQSPFILGVNV